MQLKSTVKSLCMGVLRIAVFVVGPFVIPLMKLMALSGEGTDRCLKHGFLPVPVHYYHPIPDIDDLEERKVWDRVSKLQGIRFEPEKYAEYLKRLAQKYAHECTWPNEPSPDPRQFYLHNGCFSYGCAAPLHCIIRYEKPQRIIEIGSGNSSRVIAAAIELNRRENHPAQYTIIDPYSSLSLDHLPENTSIIRQPVEITGLETFQALGENDILFIDSSHVCKLGSDVNFEILEILPRLNKGVSIHFHDISLPFEYPKIYATNPKFRVFWTEAYLLQAFLIGNDDFQIMLPMGYLENCYLEDLIEAFPHSRKTDFGWVSGSFWIKRVSESRAR